MKTKFHSYFLILFETFFTNVTNKKNHNNWLNKKKLFKAKECQKNAQKTQNF